MSSDRLAEQVHELIMLDEICPVDAIVDDPLRGDLLVLLEERVELIPVEPGAFCVVEEGDLLQGSGGEEACRHAGHAGHRDGL